MKNLLSVIAIATVIFCFAACEDAISPPLEYGNVRISFANDAARTVYPSKVFDHYVYTFTKQSGVPQVMNPSNGMFTLEIGNWNVCVDAYIGAAVAAFGTANFTLNADEGKTVSILLQAEEATGYGTFKYHIQYPAGTAVEAFTLTKMPEMTTILLNPVIIENTITGTTGNVPAGMYLLNVRLANGGLYAGTNEIAHIYALLTTEYGTAQSPIVFDEQDFSNPLPITNAEIIITAPVKKMIPDTAANGTGHFSIGAISWSPNDDPFLGGTVYTATVTLTAHSGYTFTKLSTATFNGQGAVIANNTGDAVTLSYTFPETDTRTATGIAIKTQPTKLAYTHGDPLDLTGLAVTLAHDDNTTEDVAAADFFAKNITVNPAHGNHLVHLEHNGQPVTITYGSLTPITTAHLTVNPKAITFVVDPIRTQTYTGIPHTPTVTVKDGTAILMPIIDYTVAYANNINAGTAAVTITGAGNYAGSSGNASFTILQPVPVNRIEYYWVNQHGNLVTTSNGAITIASGGTLTITAQGNGYVVQQWHLNGANTGQSGNSYNFSSTTAGKHTVGLFVKKDGKLYNTNIIITVIAYYTVTFDANGGSGTAPTAQTVVAGSSITLPSGSGLTKSGYTFGGWNTNTSGMGNNYSAGASYIVNNSTTLYARWISPNGSEAAPFPLVVNTWTDGSITLTASGSAVWYSFNVTSGTMYYVWWNGGYSGYGDGTKTLDIYASASYSNGTSVFSETNQGWTSPRSFTASSSGTVKIKVYPYTSGKTGTFAVAYSTNSTRPSSTSISTRTVTIAMWDYGTSGTGDGWDTNAALRINVNGTNLEPNARLVQASGNSVGSYTFIVDKGDTVQIYWVSGGTYDYECAFAVYYSDAPPNPAFSPTTGEAVDNSGRLLVYLQYRPSGTPAVGNGTLMGSFTVP